MPTTAIIFGLIFILQGVLTYFVSESKSFTAFIPSIIGALLLICGVIARNPNLRKHAMHGAAMVGLIGVLGGLRGVGQLFSGKDVNLAIGSMLFLGALSLVFVILCVRSFINARRANKI